MITALTDLLSAVMTTGQIKTDSSQEPAQSFANGGVGHAVLLMLLFNTVNVTHGARVAG